jgi:hypothetical protein
LEFQVPEEWVGDFPDCCPMMEQHFLEQAVLTGTGGAGAECLTERNGLQGRFGQVPADALKIGVNDFPGFVENGTKIGDGVEKQLKNFRRHDGGT